MASKINFTLNNGIQIPALGYGTWRVGQNDFYSCMSE